jgi:NADPH-dependent 2,4-dienoyl-CoA reductase/sulfur reductase-like enzyme/rhodanese-related sulfurtransferase/two-component sensor histidine kinase
MAHQLSSPVTGIRSMLDILLGEYAGSITPKQRELLERAQARCTEALDSIQRLLAVARATAEGGAEAAPVDDLLRVVADRFRRPADERGITLDVDSHAGGARVRGSAAALGEALGALVANALKYTPEHGRVEVLATREEEKGEVTIVVADSGVGIPEKDRERIFEPFVRADSARASARPGVGLGLAFVKSIVEQVGGSIRAGKSPLGGAAFSIRLPPAGEPEREDTEEAGMRSPMKVVIVGGVAAGPKAASKIIRLMPDAEVTIIDKGEFLSYAGCGLPYYLAGVVKEQKELMSTAVGVLRDPVFFQQVKNVRVMSHTEAVEVDRGNRRVRARRLPGGEAFWLDYDKLVLATGAGAVVPDIPGVDRPNVFTLHGVKDAEGIRAALAEGKARDVVIMGGGLLGVETTEALVSRGCRVTIVEKLPHILQKILDPEIAALVERHLESQGVKVLTETEVRSFEGKDRVTGVVTDAGTLPADLVILSIGVQPNVELAEQAGLDIADTGGVAVDDHMRTSDPHVYAAGDCAAGVHRLTGRPCYVPMGSTANKQGRVAAVNICGGDDRFPGVLGTAVCKVFEYGVARTGLTEGEARGLGYDVGTVLAPAPDKAHYMPTARMLMLKLVFDRGTRKLLGVQAAGPGDGDKRVDVAAMAITAGMTVDEVANADLCYAPPYAPAMDNLITAANVARNKLDGYMSGVTPAELHRMLESDKDVAVLDVRTPAEYDQERLPGSVHVPLGTLRGRLADVPRDRPIVTVCKLGLRGYEAALVLRSAGFEDVRVLDGGLTMWPYERVA